MTAWPAHGVVIDSPLRRARHIRAVPDLDTLTDAERAYVERRYFDWCAARGIPPTPPGATTPPPVPLAGPPAPGDRPRTRAEIDAAWRAINDGVRRRG